MKIFKGLEEVVEKVFPLGEMTTFGVGGSAEYFIRPRSEEALADVLARCNKAGIEVRAVGRGSNLLVKDEGVSVLSSNWTAKASAR